MVQFSFMSSVIVWERLCECYELGLRFCQWKPPIQDRGTWTQSVIRSSRALSRLARASCNSIAVCQSCRVLTTDHDHWTDRVFLRLWWRRSRGNVCENTVVASSSSFLPLSSWPKAQRLRLTAHFTSTHRLKSKGFSTEGVVIRRGFPCPRLLSTSGSLSPLKNGECCGCRDKHRAVSCSEVFCTDLLCSGLLYECSCLISWKMTGVEILCVCFP